MAAASLQDQTALLWKSGKSARAIFERKLNGTVRECAKRPAQAQRAQLAVTSAPTPSNRRLVSDAEN